MNLKKLVIYILYLLFCTTIHAQDSTNAGPTLENGISGQEISIGKDLNQNNAAFNFQLSALNATNLSFGTNGSDLNSFIELKAEQNFPDYFGYDTRTNRNTRNLLRISTKLRKTIPFKMFNKSCRQHAVSPCGSTEYYWNSLLPAADDSENNFVNIRSESVLGKYGNSTSLTYAASGYYPKISNSSNSTVTDDEKNVVNRSIIFQDHYDNSITSTQSYLKIVGHESLSTMRSTKSDTSSASTNLFTGNFLKQSNQVELYRNIMSFSNSRVVVGDWAEDRKSQFLTQSDPRVRLVVAANRNHQTRKQETLMGKSRGLGSLLVRKVYPATSKRAATFRHCFHSNDPEDNCWAYQWENVNSGDSVPDRLATPPGLGLIAKSYGQYAWAINDDDSRNHRNLAGGNPGNNGAGSVAIANSLIWKHNWQYANDYKTKTAYKYKMPFGTIRSKTQGQGTIILDRNRNEIQMGWDTTAGNALEQWMRVRIRPQGGQSNDFFIALKGNTQNNRDQMGRDATNENFIEIEFKTFVIDHPTKRDKYLVHAAIEGPSVDVFYTGSSQLKNGKTMITLPEYFSALTKKEGITVQLTPIDGFDPLILKDKNGQVVQNNTFTVSSSIKDSNQKFDWVVKAIRNTNQEQIVEPLKKDINLKRFGPYTYNGSK